MHNPIANAILHVAASEITILGDHDEALSGEIKCVRRGLYAHRTSTGGASDDQPVAHRVLGNGSLGDELEQVIGPAGLHAGAREAVSAERLAGDHRAGDAPVDVQVPDRGRWR